MSACALFVVLVLVLASCRGDPPPRLFDDARAALELVPPAPLDRAPRVLRVRVPIAAGADPGSIVLVRGDVGASSLAEIVRGDLSKALRDRVVPSIAWREDERAVLAPTVVLEAGATYSIAIPKPAGVKRIVVATDDSVPIGARLWPPAGGSATSSFAVWCAPSDLPSIGERMALDPEGASGLLARGVDGATAPACVTFRASGERASGPFVPPPIIGEGPRLDPSPIAIDTNPPLVTAIDCALDETPFGLGCARVEDDRARVRTPPSALLWVVSGAGVDRVRAARPHEPFVVAPLVPSTVATVHVRAIDTAGRASEATATLSTGAPRAHLILNEVLADPVGPEPNEEWVEIVNDGSVEGSLAGLSLDDTGGATPLPDVHVPPGRFALIVNEGFVADDGSDVPPDASAILVRVPKLGKNGLANAGEPLRLVDPSGAVLSAFPGVPKPRSGFSVARVHPSDPDASDASFALAQPTPGAPNRTAP